MSTSGQTSVLITEASVWAFAPALTHSKRVDLPVPLPPIIQVRFLLKLIICLSNKPPSIVSVSKQGTTSGKSLSILTLELPLNKAILNESNVKSSIFNLVSFASSSIFLPSFAIVCASDDISLGKLSVLSLSSVANLRFIKRFLSAALSELSSSVYNFAFVLFEISRPYKFSCFNISSI